MSSENYQEKDVYLTALRIIRIAFVIYGKRFTVVQRLNSATKVLFGVSYDSEHLCSARERIVQFYREHDCNKEPIIQCGDLRVNMHRFMEEFGEYLEEEMHSYKGPLPVSIASDEDFRRQGEEEIQLRLI